MSPVQTWINRKMITLPLVLTTVILQVKPFLPSSCSDSLPSQLLALNYIAIMQP